MKKIVKIIDREKLVYIASEYAYDFSNFKTIRTFGRNIYEDAISLEEANEDQSDLVNEIKKFSNKTRPQNDDKNEKKKLFLKACIIFVTVEKKFLMDLRTKYF